LDVLNMGALHFNLPVIADTVNHRRLKS